MARLSTSVIPRSALEQAVLTLQRMLDAIVNQLNSLTEGRIAAITNAASSAPVGGTTAYVQGDFVRNSAPVELGSSGSKYIVTGWTCVVSGTPGTWVQNRTLTGN